MLALEGERPTSKSQENTVFISYAREDFQKADRLYNDLKNAGLNPWLDEHNLLPGQNRRDEIENAISKSRYFIPLFSKTSVEKIGYVQSEFKFALDVLKSYPPNKIFYIPIRLDDCEILYKELEPIHRADLFPVDDDSVWRKGVSKILQAIGLDIPESDKVKPTPKLSPPFRGEKKIFVDREDYICNTIKEHLKPSSRVSIIGPGGSGKSQLAFKAIHEYEKEGVFDLVIPIYLDRMITFDQFLLRLAEKLGISQNQFEKYDLDERKNTITNALSDKHNPLILVDNFETILYAIPSSVTDYNKENNGSTDIASLPSSEDNAIQIKDYLNNNISDNTSILVTSRERYNLDSEKRIDLEGLREDDSNKLFAKLAVDEQLKELSAEPQVRQKINNLITKTGGHPLSIEILAKNIRSIKEIEEASTILGSKVNRNEPVKRLRSLEESLGFTLTNLDDKLRQLLSNLILFKSPFAIPAATEIFGAGEGDIFNLYERTLLTRIESNDGRIEKPEYWLYKLHPAIRNYLESKMAKNLEEEYGEAFSRYYLNFLSNTHSEWGKENHVPSIARFNIIVESEYNDFDRAIELTKNSRLGAEIAWCLGAIFLNLGILSKALGYHRRSLGIHEELNDRDWMGADYTNIGNALMLMGKYQEALDSHNKALNIAEELNDRVRMAEVYGNVVELLRNMGKLQEALDSHNKALNIDEELNDRKRLGNDYTSMGIVLLDMGKLQEALDSLNKALKIHEELNERVWMATDYSDIAFVLSKTSKDEALKSLYNALSILQEFERENNYRHPLMDKVNSRISDLKA
jgi:tetratricopeptide (TPR) repeat protein